jgi:hypothetical protein
MDSLHMEPLMGSLSIRSSSQACPMDSLSIRSSNPVQVMGSLSIRNSSPVRAMGNLHIIRSNRLPGKVLPGIVYWHKLMKLRAR